MTAVTLGIVGQRGFNRQMGRNQAFNHAGNVAGAALSGYLGRKFGLTPFSISADERTSHGVVSGITVTLQ